MFTNNKIIVLLLSISSISLLIIAFTLVFKTFYYDRVSEWKLISEEDHVYILKNGGEDICYVYTNTASMITGKWVKTHCE